MPTGADIKVDHATSFLLIGDGGTHKTYFIGTCPTPAYIFDCDAGMAVHHGRADIHFDTFKEVDKGIKLTEWQKANGFYEYGRAWMAILAKLNEIGRLMDSNEPPYKTIGFDSLTTLVDYCLSHILRENGGPFRDGRQMWLPFLNNMKALFSQFTAWQVVKVLTAHVKRDENLVTQTIEKLPNISGQFAGTVPIYFDEVYYTEVKQIPVDEKKPEGPRKSFFYFNCVQDGTIKQAKSRKYNLPNGLETDFRVIMKYLQERNK